MDALLPSTPVAVLVLKAANADWHLTMCLSSIMGSWGCSAHCTHVSREGGRAGGGGTPLRASCTKCMATANSSTLSCPSLSTSASCHMLLSVCWGREECRKKSRALPPAGKGDIRMVCAACSLTVKTTS